MKDFGQVHPEYMGFGVQLHVPVHIIQGFEKKCNNDTSTILIMIFGYWLSNTHEEKWFKQLCSALEFVNLKSLVTIVEEKYMKKSSQGICYTLAFR